MRYALAYPKPSLLSWILLAVYITVFILFMVLGPLILKVIFGYLVILRVLRLMTGTLLKQFVEIGDETLRFRLGVLPPYRLSYSDVAAVGEAPGRPNNAWTGLVKMSGLQLFNSNTELLLRRRIWVVALAPIPIPLPARAIRLPLPLPEQETFIEDLRTRLLAA
ncbi:MAG: hypothetical protein A2W34_07860 [Chloroflexi bacterium RBG_16_64_32]|nr:MAG: hypothetical protein A2W34_07860 [Chloroflexi bacterium RBG_16_64_32]